MSTTVTGFGNQARGTVRGSPRLRKVMLTLHLVTALGLIGIASVLSALGAAGWSGADPETIYPAMSLVARAVLTPLIVLALVVGITQALIAGYGLTRHWWVTTKLVILSALVLVEVAVVLPGLGRAADAATTAGQEVTTAQQITATLAPATAMILMLVAASLGVFKPGPAHRRLAGDALARG